MRGYVLALLLVWSAPSMATDTGNPHIQFSDNVFNFGKVFRGQNLVYNFKFKNTGNSNLMIVGTHSGCGCTAVEAEQSKQYAPGESGSIRLNFDTSDFSGVVTKVVTVMTNEKITPMRTLTVKADIQEEFIVSPPLADFGLISAENIPNKQIKINAAQGKTFKIQKLKYDQKKLKVSYQELGNNAEITVGLLPDNAPGPFSETVLVTNNSKNLRELPIYVTATILGNIQPSTNRLTFGSIDKNSSENKELNLSGKKDFKVVAMSTDLYLNGSPIAKKEPFIQLETKEHNSKNKTVSVVLKNSSDQAGVVHGEIKLTTDDQAQKEIKIELRGFFE